MLIVLTGIDGTGKSTAARALVTAAREDGGNALLLSNHAGRRRMSVLAERSMPEYPDFVQLDADCPPADVVDRLARIVCAETAVTA